ncbi:ArsC/Spx/MgsR family protein [Yunchengibacter salinarum]|uniref:ArsC/Spx/MgsR family protein n=1 Tax=Yunchengibacter salinarum TaxID=3133399 RepID=UPI0035B5BE87
MTGLCVYGITNCDKVRATLKRLGQATIPARLHDVRKDGLSRDTAARILAAIGAGRAINRRSTSWRALDEATRAWADDPARAADLLVAHPLLLARPVLERADGALWQGFSAPQVDTMLAWAAEGR